MKVVPAAILSLCTVAALAGGAKPDPIVGTYNTVATTFTSSFIEGIPDLSLEGSEPFDFTFESDNHVTIGTLEGTWKRKGSKYTANISKAYQAFIAELLEAPKAKAKFKAKNIKRGAEFGIGGKVEASIGANIDGLLHEQVMVGYFTGAK